MGSPGSSLFIGQILATGWLLPFYRVSFFFSSFCSYLRSFLSSTSSLLALLLVLFFPRFPFPSYLLPRC